MSYNGGGLFELVFILEYKRTGKVKRLFDNVLTCLLEMKEEGRFDEVRLLIGVEREPLVP